MPGGRQEVYRNVLDISELGEFFLALPNRRLESFYIEVQLSGFRGAVEDFMLFYKEVPLKKSMIS